MVTFCMIGCAEKLLLSQVWTGGNTVCVQMGDVLDRGDQEIGASRGRPSIGYDLTIARSWSKVTMMGWVGG